MFTVRDAKIQKFVFFKTWNFSCFLMIQEYKQLLTIPVESSLGYINATGSHCSGKQRDAAGARAITEPGPHALASREDKAAASAARAVCRRQLLTSCDFAHNRLGFQSVPKGPNFPSQILSPLWDSQINFCSVYIQQLCKLIFII